MHYKNRGQSHSHAGFCNWLPLFIDLYEIGVGDHLFILYSSAKLLQINPCWIHVWSVCVLGGGDTHKIRVTIIPRIVRRSQN